MAKKLYLTAYDYGSGGVWNLIAADSESEITDKYPELKVVSQRPDWMTDPVYEDIRRESSYDAKEPSGWLLKLIQNRAAGRPPT